MAKVETRRAAKAFEAFTGRPGQRVTRQKIQHDDAAGWKLGPVVGIAYEATRDGKRAQYFHEFEAKARPDLISRDDGRQLFITGGNYTVTERGIEDNMPELFIVNPSPRGGAARKGRKVMALKRRKAKRAPARKPAQIAVFRTNPKRRKRAAGSRQMAVFRSNPVKRRRRTYKRNPIAGISGASNLLVPAMGIGAGAVGSEIFMGYLPIPAGFKQGIARHVTKGAVGVAAGLLLQKVFKQKRLGLYVMAGAVVIATHDAIKEFIAARLPMVNQTGFGQYVSPLASQFGGMGYINPAAAVSFGQYVSPPASQFDGMSQAYDEPGGETDFRA